MAQADALEIEAQAKRRIANEYDARRRGATKYQATVATGRVISSLEAQNLILA
jgi:hypothetical protein